MTCSEKWSEVNTLAREKRPFAFLRLPDGQSMLFRDDEIFLGKRPHDISRRYFFISPFPEKHALTPLPWPSPTSEVEYLGSLDNLIRELGPDEKVVISRVITGSFARAGIDVLLERISSYFDSFPRAVCYFYYTPLTGFWFGASPELLLKSDSESFSTIALAGTRATSHEHNSPWDAKNIHEHNIVRDFIIDTFRRHGLTELSIGRAVTVRYNNLIEHLMTPVSATCSHDVSFATVADALSPTPALCGYPRPAALKWISSCESHPRYCYGGFFEWHDGQSDTTKAYVTLRCAHVDAEASRWCVYSGGGIVRRSVPQDELKETERKAAVILSHLQ